MESIQTRLLNIEYFKLALKVLELLPGHCKLPSLSQITKGYEFESETDTEVIPKLIKYVYDNRESDSVTFSTLVERVIQQLVSSLLNTATHTNPLYGSTRGCWEINLTFLEIS